MMDFETKLNRELYRDAYRLVRIMEHWRGQFGLRVTGDSRFQAAQRSRVAYFEGPTGWTDDVRRRKFRNEMARRRQPVLALYA